MIHNKYFEIMEKFLSNYNNRIYGRQLVGKVPLSQKNIALTLEELERKNILVSKVEGKQKYYLLNKQNPLLKLHVLKAEITKTQRFLLKNPKLKLALDKIKGDIICVFGSYAKGVEKINSDIDLFVVDADKTKIKEAGKMFNINLSPKLYSEKQFKMEIKNPLIKEIIENHVIIKGFEKFVDILWSDYYEY